MARKPDSLKKVMEKENITWRTFADDGSIMKNWNSPPTPAFYLIDHEGIIRHKWMGHPGKTVLETSIMSWIKKVKR